MSWMRSRTTDPELLDGDGVDWADRLDALDQLPLVNRFLGGAPAVLTELRAAWSDLPASHRLRLLDVGCGAGDIPEALVGWANRRGLCLRVMALDRDPAALELACRRAARLAGNMVLIRGSALRLPFADRALDAVIASMVCHHFFGPELVALLGELTRVSADLVLINDLHRHPAAYAGFWLGSRLFLRGHVVRHDGEVSVRRGFRAQELLDLAGRFADFRWRVRRRFAFRLCLVGRRRG